MGVIQSAINQGISTVALAARLNPSLEAKAQIKQGKQEIENLKEAQAQAYKLGQDEAAGVYQEKLIQKSQELVGKHPKAKGIKDVQKNLPMTFKEDPEFIAMERAELSLQDRQEQAVK